MNTNRSARLTPETPAAPRPRSPRLLLLLALVALACGEAVAQEAGAADQQRDEGPPPLRYLPVDVRGRLEAEQNPKDRAKLAMQICEERLLLAAQHAEQDRFVAATGEVGVYEAVVDDTIRYLHKPGRANNKLRDTFKRVEITLRSHVTRLESIRRALPSQHAVHLKNAIDFVRDRRDVALGAFYSDSVLREPRRPETQTPAGERATTIVPARADEEKKPERQQ